jgi:sortase A
MTTVLRWLSRLLVSLAALCLALVALTVAEQWYYRSAARALAASVTVAAGVPASPAAKRPSDGGSPIAMVDSATDDPAVVLSPPGGLIGELDIPHLRVATAIVEGDDATALRRGAGHVRGTAMAGDFDNVVLAGHRDTVFRRLGDLARGDRLRLTTRRGVFHYRVARTLRVRPGDTWVLDRHAAALTLITCYPFNWIGSAPERWIVQAEAIETDLSAASAPK